MSRVRSIPYYTSMPPMLPPSEPCAVSQQHCVSPLTCALDTTHSHPCRLSIACYTGIMMDLGPNLTLNPTLTLILTLMVLGRSPLCAMCFTYSRQGWCGQPCCDTQSTAEQEHLLQAWTPQPSLIRCGLRPSVSVTPLHATGVIDAGRSPRDGAGSVGGGR